MITIVDQSELFEAVQLSGIFPDSKTFPDMVALRNIKEIAAEFNEIRNRDSFSLKEFVSINFKSVIPNEETFVTQNTDNPAEHIHRLWPHLTKRTNPENTNSTYIALPNDFVVPGGRFQETYYWDSYFTMLGLIISEKYDLVVGMIENFAFLIDQHGFIPNGNRTYFLSRSQPPFFSLMVGLLDRFESNKKPIDFINQLEKEYDFWMANRGITMPDGETLNRYDDTDASPRPESYIEDLELSEISNQKPGELYRNLRAACESGWDFSSRWLTDNQNLSTIKTTDIVPVDLNCLLYNLEMTLSVLHISRRQEFFEKANSRKGAILKYFWNENLHFFCDYALQKQSKRVNLTLAGVFPLYFNLANTAQAKAVSEILDQQFLKKGGLLTTTIESGQQWDAPNGWAPLQWMAYIGLKNYGLGFLAKQIKTNWMAQNEAVFFKSGKFTEKYNVESNTAETGGGEYPNQDGFGWSNGVYLSFQNEV